MVQWLQRFFSRPAPVAPAGPAPVVPAVRTGPAAPAGSASTCAPISFDQQDKVNGSYLRWLFDDDGESILDIDPLEAEVLDALAAIAASRESGAALVRRMPGLIPQLLQSLRSDNFSGTQLARTISGDVVLVAAVIRAANSACKGGGTTISSVEHAIMLIGHEGLRHLITSVAFRPIIDMNSGYYTRTLAPRIWDQSERCAQANRALAGAMRIDPFEAFLAGLVQQVGLIVSLRMMDQVVKGRQAAQGATRLGSEIFCARLVHHARILTCSIGREWNFPENVTRAILDQAGTKKGTVMSPLGRLLSLTDYLSKLRILVENDRMADGDPALFRGVPADAVACYRSLDALAEGEPAAP